MAELCLFWFRFQIRKLFAVIGVGVKVEVEVEVEPERRIEFMSNA